MLINEHCDCDCNDIITHVQANNRITTLQLQHYQWQRSLQKVQGHRTAQGRSRRGRDSTHRRPCGTPPPNPATLCDRSVQGSKSWHSGSFAKYSDIGLVTISFPVYCVSHRATGLPVMVHDMHTRRTRPDYLQACPTGPPVDGVKSALTPALWPCTFCSDPTTDFFVSLFSMPVLP